MNSQVVDPELASSELVEAVEGLRIGNSISLVALHEFIP